MRSLKVKKGFSSMLDSCEIRRSGPQKEYLVSALVPLYNAESFLPGLIEDLEAQTIAEHTEIVFCNTASPQKEQAILAEAMRRYSNIVSIYVPHRENPHEALNRCLRVARGRYFTLACADDRHRPDAFEKLVTVLEGRKQVGLVYADSLITKGKNETFFYNTAHAVFRWPEYSLRQALMYAPFGPQPLWRREVHQLVGDFDPNLVVVGDYDMFLRIARHFGAHHVSEILGLFRSGGMSITHSESCFRETQQVLQKYRAVIPIEEVYPGLKEEWAGDTFARAAALMDYARSLLIASSVPADADFVHALYIEAQELIGSTPVLKNNLAALLWLTGNHQEATTLWERLALFGNELALKNLRAVQSTGPGQTPPLSLGALRHPVVRVLPELVPPDQTQQPWSAQSPQCLLEPCGKKAIKDRISFIVITGGTRAHLLPLLVNSIRLQNIPHYEIILCGNLEGVQLAGDDVVLLSSAELAAEGKLGAMRNLGLERARFETVVFLDDDCILDAQWYAAFLRGPDVFDVLTMQVRLPDGTRYWDQVTKSPQRGQMILQEGEEDWGLYATGGASLMRREVAMSVGWNPELRVGQAEDIDFSQRCRAMGFTIQHWSPCCIYHADSTYTSLGRWVYRRQKGRTYEWVQEINPSDPHGIYTEAMARFETGELAEGIDCLRWGALHYPQNRWFRLGLAAIEFMSGGHLPQNAWYPDGWPTFKRWMDVLAGKCQPESEKKENACSVRSVESEERPLDPYLFPSRCLEKGEGQTSLVPSDTREPLDGMVFTWTKCGVEPCLSAIWKTAHEPSMPLLERVLFKAHRADAAETPADLLIRCDPAGSYLKTEGLQVGRFQWPTLLPHAHWLAAWQNLDALWVPTAFQKERLLEVGFSPDDVQVVPFFLNGERYRPREEGVVDQPPLKGLNSPYFFAHFEWSRAYAWETLVRAFMQAFSPSENIALVLYPFATHEAGMQRMLQEIQSCLIPLLLSSSHPHILLQTEPLEPEVLQNLYRDCLAFVSAARTADIKRPLLEAMAYGRPVVAPAWAASQEFVSDATGYMVAFQETPVHFVATLEKPYLKEGRWIELEEIALQQQLRAVFEDLEGANARGMRARALILERNDYRRAHEPLLDALQKLFPNRNPSRVMIEVPF